MTGAASRSRSVLVVVVLVLLTAGLSAPAGAHATLVGSDPADGETVQEAPSEVVLRFDDPVVAEEEGSVRVLDPGGRHLEQGRPHRRAGGTTLVQEVGSGARGTHTVSYRVLSDDGHVLAGSYVFHVGGATRSTPGGGDGTGLAVSLAGVAGRALGYAGALLAVGATGVALLVDTPPIDAPGRRGDRRRSRRRRSPPSSTWTSAGVLAVIGSGSALVALSAELAGGTLVDGVRALPAAVSAMGWAEGPPAQLMAAAILVALAQLSRRVAWAAAPAGAAGVALLVLFGLSGHASTTSAVAVGVDLVHLGGAALWVGGLAAVALSWVPDRDRMARFGRVSLASVVAVGVSGAISAFWLSGGRDLVVDTTTSSAWGRTLGVKVAVVAAVVFFGWMHRQWIADVAQPVTGMIRTVRIEVVLCAGVLVATAVLVGRPPPRDIRAEPWASVGRAGEVTVRIEVAPARPGGNTVHLWFLTADGEPSAVDAAELEVSSTEVEARREPVELYTPFHGTAEVDLTAGSWTVDVIVVQGGAPATTEFEVPVP